MRNLLAKNYNDYFAEDKRNNNTFIWFTFLNYSNKLRKYYVLQLAMYKMVNKKFEG